jgi:hypothetical protein
MGRSRMLNATTFKVLDTSFLLGHSKWGEKGGGISITQTKRGKKRTSCGVGGELSAERRAVVLPSRKTCAARTALA